METTSSRSAPFVTKSPQAAVLMASAEAPKKARNPNTPAPRAAGKIHSDIERGFIRAEVVPWEQLIEQGSEAKCKEAGLLRVEGKDYVIQDGDVVNFRFNV